MLTIRANSRISLRPPVLAHRLRPPGDMDFTLAPFLIPPHRLFGSPAVPECLYVLRSERIRESDSRNSKVKIQLVNHAIGVGLNDVFGYINTNPIWVNADVFDPVELLPLAGERFGEKHFDLLGATVHP